MEKIKAILLSAIILIVTHKNALAQCAMCRATAESATNHVDQGIGGGLNNGIVYLMLLPYLLMGTIAFVFFRKKIIGFFKPEAA